MGIVPFGINCGTLLTIYMQFSHYLDWIQLNVSYGQKVIWIKINWFQCFASLNIFFITGFDFHFEGKIVYDRFIYWKPSIGTFRLIKYIIFTLKSNSKPSMNMKIFTHKTLLLVKFCIYRSRMTQTLLQMRHKTSGMT